MRGGPGIGTVPPRHPGSRSPHQRAVTRGSFSWHDVQPQIAEDAPAGVSGARLGGTGDRDTPDEVRGRGPVEDLERQRVPTPARDPANRPVLRPAPLPHGAKVHACVPPSAPLPAMTVSESQATHLSSGPEATRRIPPKGGKAPNGHAHRVSARPLACRQCPHLVAVARAGPTSINGKLVERPGKMPNPKQPNAGRFPSGRARSPAASTSTSSRYLAGCPPGRNRRLMG